MHSAQYVSMIHMAVTHVWFQYVSARIPTFNMPCKTDKSKDERPMLARQLAIKMRFNSRSGALLRHVTLYWIIAITDASQIQFESKDRWSIQLHVQSVTR